MRRILRLQKQVNNEKIIGREGAYIERFGRKKQVEGNNVGS